MALPLPLPWWLVTVSILVSVAALLNAGMLMVCRPLDSNAVAKVMAWGLLLSSEPLVRVMVNVTESAKAASGSEKSTTNAPVTVLLAAGAAKVGACVVESAMVQSWMWARVCGLVRHGVAWLVRAWRRRKQCGAYAMPATCAIMSFKARNVYVMIERGSHLVFCTASAIEHPSVSIYIATLVAVFTCGDKILAVSCGSCSTRGFAVRHATWRRGAVRCGAPISM